MLLTKELKKYVKSLHQIKFRQKYNKFIAEGPKICFEFMHSGKFEIDHIICTEVLLRENEQLISRFTGKTIICNDKELKSISGLVNPNKILMVLGQSHYNSSEIDLDKAWGIYCDRIQDPGNMGTILRIADWFDFPLVLSSADSVDFYNPKVIQSAMGAHNRVGFREMSPESLIQDHSSSSYVLALGGQDMNTVQFPKGGLIVVGNESRGVRDEILNNTEHHISIKKYGGAESLNASIACGIASNHIRSLLD